MSPNGDGQAGDCKFPEFSARLQSASAAKSLNNAQLAAKIGITRGTMERYWKGDRLPAGDNLVSIADALDVSERWLIRGHNKELRGHIVDAESAEWVVVPEYDLREMTDISKGEVVSETPFRRDWLYQSLGQAAGLWITKMPSDYEGASLYEGDRVFVRDVEAGEATDKALYLVRIDGTLTVARLNALAGTGMIADRVGETLIPFKGFGKGEQYVPVARILGAPMKRV